MWDSFISTFCKVQFLCYSGDPNWLGWVVIGWGGLAIFGLLLLAVVALFHT
jgi:hypothetical protein